MPMTDITVPNHGGMSCDFLRPAFEPLLRRPLGLGERVVLCALFSRLELLPVDRLLARLVFFLGVSVCATWSSLPVKTGLLSR